MQQELKILNCGALKKILKLIKFPVVRISTFV